MPGTDTADFESLYERMLRIRLVEDAVHRLFLNNEIEGTTHLYQGQEAVATEAERPRANLRDLLGRSADVA